MLFASSSRHITVKFSGYQVRTALRHAFSCIYYCDWTQKNIKPRQIKEVSSIALIERACFPRNGTKQALRGFRSLLFGTLVSSGRDIPY